MTGAWRETVSWSTLLAGGERRFSADAATRARITEALGLEGLERLEADLAFNRWLDGAVVHGTVRAIAVRRCGVSLDLFPETIQEPFDLPSLPAGSQNAPEVGAEVEVDVEGEDPPEVVTGNSVDLGGLSG